MEPQATPQPQTPPILPNPPTPQVKNSLVLIMSILLIVTVAIAGLFYFQIQKLSKELSKYQIQPSPTPLVSPEPSAKAETADWKTYTSVKDNYQISYPQDWKFDDTIMGTSFTISNPNKKYPDGTLTFSAILGQNSCDADMSSAKNWNWQNLQGKSTTVGGIEGTELSGKTDYTNGIYYDRKFILIKGKNSCYTFDYWSYDGNQTNTLDQILSTFKFLDRTEDTSTNNLVTKEEAAQLVRSLDEVKKFVTTVPKGIVEFDHESEDKQLWVIHVYEIKNGHTATFNWYEVDKTSGAITKMFN